MRNVMISLLLTAIIIFCPADSLAADLNVNIVIDRQDGATCSELWIDNRLVWRLVLLADGAKPVVYKESLTKTSLVIPDIVNGMFVVKVE